MVTMPENTALVVACGAAALLPVVLGLVLVPRDRKKRYVLGLRFRSTLGDLFDNSRRRLRRLLGSRYAAPVPGDREFPAEWLTTVLRSSGQIPRSAQVSTANAELLRGAGLSGDIHRIQLTYSGSGVPPSAPATVVAKLTRPGMGRLAVVARGEAREGKFYAEFGRDLGGLMPKCHYARGNMLTGSAVLVMEDLKALTTSATPLLGSDVWAKIGLAPAQAVPDGAPTGLRLLEESFLRAADLNAKYWNDKRLLRKSWLKGTEWLRGKGRATWEVAVSRGESDWRNGKAKAVDATCVYKLDPALAAVIDRSFAATSWAALQTHLRDPSTPFTLTHGDFHANNMLWLNEARATQQAPVGNWFEDTRVVWIDWSEASAWEPIADLSDMMISDGNPELWAHSEALLRRYYARLQERGVDLSRYSFEKCRERFNSAGVEKWVYCFSLVANYPPGMPGAFVQHLHDQLLGFIRAHGDLPAYPIKALYTLL